MNKKELRKFYRDKRANFSAADVVEKSATICSRLFYSFDFSLINSVHVFLPIDGKQEINTWTIINFLWERYPHIQVLVPKMKGEELHTYKLNQDTLLEKNEWEIPEPIDSEICENTRIDLVLVPLLAFDKIGHRVGYGKGFYDKFLNTCHKKVIKVGLSFFEVEEKIDSDVHDIPLNFCVTPNSLYQF